jgi:putative SOS response-associated peptidase YedK
MCGRYRISRVDLLHYGVRGEPSPGFEEFDEKKVIPRFNVAPRQFVPIVRTNSRGERVVSMIRWGLIPYWTKGKPKSEPINARCEAAATSAMFRDAMNRRRCLVIADGFYEWRGSKAPKQPFFIHFADDRPFAFAGIWERWKPDESAEPVDTFAILTSEPNELIRPIHNRMPVIINPKDYDRWLDRNMSAEEITDILAPHEAEGLEAYEVGTAVNNVRNEGPDLAKRIA